MDDIDKIIKHIKNIKKNFGCKYFQAKGLYGLVCDESKNDIDKRFINVLKKAEDFELPEKLSKLKSEDKSSQKIGVPRLRPQFVQDLGLDPTIAGFVFDVYLFGLDYNQEFIPINSFIKSDSNKNKHITDTWPSTISKKLFLLHFILIFVLYN